MQGFTQGTEGAVQGTGHGSVCLKSLLLAEGKAWRTKKREMRRGWGRNLSRKSKGLDQGEAVRTEKEMGSRSI